MPTPERRPSKGAAIHRREVLARRNHTPVDKEVSLEEKGLPEDRLRVIEQQLSSKNLGPEERASKFIELAWLNFRVGKIDKAKRQSLIQNLLNKLELEQPEVFKGLIEETGTDLNRLSQIRDSVMTSRIIAGYYSKRGH